MVSRVSRPKYLSEGHSRTASILEMTFRPSSFMSRRRALNFSSNCPRIPELAIMAIGSLGLPSPRYHSRELQGWLSFHFGPNLVLRDKNCPPNVWIRLKALRCSSFSDPCSSCLSAVRIRGHRTISMSSLNQSDPLVLGGRVAALVGLVRLGF